MSVKGDSMGEIQKISIPNASVKLGYCLFYPPEIPDMEKTVSISGKKMRREKFYDGISNS